MTEILDSGNRTEYETGAVRDIQTGKGRCDLMPLQTISKLMDDKVLEKIGEFAELGGAISLKLALLIFAKEHYSGIYGAILDVSIHYEQGAKKYGIDNWKKGIPVSSYIDSAVRHYLKFRVGHADERHDRAFVWNLLCALWTIDNKPELVDLPRRVE